MKKIVLLSLLCAPLLSSLPAQASKFSELKITGEILPPSCSLNLDNGEVNFGTMSASSLRAGQRTELPGKSVGFSIQCASPQNVALKVTDNRSNSRVPGITSYPDHINFGLGMAGDKKIGGYNLHVNIQSFNNNGWGADLIESRNNNANWDTSSGFAPHHGPLISFSESDAKSPSPLQHMRGTLSLRTFLNKREELPSGQDVVLDSSATLELKYM